MLTYDVCFRMPGAAEAYAALTQKQHAMLDSAFFTFDEDGYEALSY
jgi:hypothetical protein